MHDETKDHGAADDDLRATEEAILDDADRLAKVEIEKQALDPADPRVDALSEVAIDLADRIGRTTRAERQLSEEIR